MRNINEEISRIKKLIIYELSEKEDVINIESPIEGDIEIDDTETVDTSMVDNFTYGACEVQDFLIKKGYLNKRDKDCDFGDITAAALGKYVGDKLGINLGINSVSDLQKYMEKLGFDTGSRGYGKLMAEKVSELINYLEDLKNKILNSPYFWKIVKTNLNYYAENLVGLKINDGVDENGQRKDEVIGEVDWLPDYYIKYPMSIKSVKVDKIDRNGAFLSGEIDLSVLIEYLAYDTYDTTVVKFSDVYVTWGFLEKNVKGKNCICLGIKVWDGVLNSSGIGFDKTYWKLYIKNNLLKINFGKLLGYNVGEIELKTIDFVGELRKNDLKRCIPYEDIIKVLVGEIELEKVNVYSVK